MQATSWLVELYVLFNPIQSNLFKSGNKAHTQAY